MLLTQILTTLMTIQYICIREKRVLPYCVVVIFIIHVSNLRMRGMRGNFTPKMIEYLPFLDLQDLGALK